MAKTKTAKQYEAELLALDELVTPFPHYALDTYLPIMVRAGHRVAICDQLNEK